jgi:hypothetical protein
MTVSVVMMEPEDISVQGEDMLVAYILTSGSIITTDTVITRMAPKSLCRPFNLLMMKKR